MMSPPSSTDHCVMQMVTGVPVESGVQVTPLSKSSLERHSRASFCSERLLFRASIRIKSSRLKQTRVIDWEA